MVTHKFDSLSYKETLCGLNVSKRKEGEYMTLSYINTTCPKCKCIFNERIKKLYKTEE